MSKPTPAPAAHTTPTRASSPTSPPPSNASHVPCSPFPASGYLCSHKGEAPR